VSLHINCTKMRFRPCSTRRRELGEGSRRKGKEWEGEEFCPPDFESFCSPRNKQAVGQSNVCSDLIREMNLNAFKRCLCLRQPVPICLESTLQLNITSTQVYSMVQISHQDQSSFRTRQHTESQTDNALARKHNVSSAEPI